MTRYDVVIVGAGLGGLTAGAILARAGRKVLVVERSNSVGGAASSYKSGELFVEGSLHETSDPNDPRDPKHDVLTRAGVIDAVKWIPSGAFYQARGGPLDQPFLMPDDFDAARRALTERFPEARRGIDQLLGEMQHIIGVANRFSQGDDATETSRDRLGALIKLLPDAADWPLSLSQKLDRVFGDHEAVKCVLAANLSYFHDDPSTLWWIYFAMAQGSYLQSGGRYVQGGSQRLSSALARAIKVAGGEVLLRRVVSAIALGDDAKSITHTAKDGSDPRTVQCARIIGNAAPAALEPLMQADAAEQLRQTYARQAPSTSLFALTLGLSKPPCEFGIAAYSTQLLPPWMKRLTDYAQGAALMAEEPGERMPPMSVVDYAAIDSGVPAPPYVLSILGPDLLSNWDASDMDAYREKRGRWQEAIVRYLSSIYPGLGEAVVASSFNSALSVRQYLNAPDGAVYGFAPTPPQAIWSNPLRSPRTTVSGLYLASAYAGFGGYTSVVQSAGLCADMILREG
ncbi:NAD(P)/FAD-dependent oxidoreductase [Bradyrhizobium sp. AUGA SZCCT0240]|uniref:phytoene desaturase family protein n=1 Tax=unclassified Bradyrhizobium TaxID=2631580 RepID=UPI001BA85BE4|nr:MULTISPECIES: FAD-dependent oxidoreductase [unclassified Bradyrhizobium]MBR1242522.1 NAD(P)/FAD-dependent oxidoreductase [Bradyrhizobium sp. AUGA SZCCT0274]MBR1258452.1 NAD(P)/FAD-dependent oxidoreductase [Bradyrhizobium sp. AUGA SZCCT0240]